MRESGFFSRKREGKGFRFQSSGDGRPGVFRRGRSHTAAFEDDGQVSRKSPSFYQLSTINTQLSTPHLPRAPPSDVRIPPVMIRSRRFRIHKNRQGPDGVAGHGAAAFEDVGGEESGGGVGVGEHFQFGVDIVDVVEEDSFRGAGEDGGAELVFAVMRADEVQEMQADGFGRRLHGSGCGRV